MRKPFQPCILCKNEKFYNFSSRDRSGDKTSIVLCRNCSMVQVNPRPTEEELANFYEKKYHISSTGSRSPKPEFIEKSKRFASQRLDILRNHTDISNASILDVGCSYGEFLRQAKPYCKSIKGIEPGKEFYDYSVEHLKLDVFNGTLDNYIDKDESKYDVITLFTVLEHVYSPISFLKKVHRILNDDGFFFLEVPNYRAYFKRVRQRRKFISYFSPYHLQYFSENTIVGVLTVAGFKPVGFDNSRGNYVRVVAKRANFNGFEFNCGRAETDMRDSMISTLSLAWFWKMKSVFV